MSLGRLPFSGLLTVIVLFGMSKSFHSVFTASSILIDVSFRSCNSGAKFLLADAISWSISFSVCMKYIYSSGMHFGFFQSFPMNFMYPVYIVAMVFLFEFFHFALHKNSSTSYGLFMLTSFNSLVRRSIMVFTADSVLPFSFSSCAYS